MGRRQLPRVFTARSPNRLACRRRFWPGGFVAGEVSAMILQAGAAIVSAWLVGVLCVAALWPPGALRRGEILMVLSLGIGVGLGVSSAFFFAASLLSITPVITWMLELLVGGGA